MIQFILMLLGLAFSDNHVNTATHNNQDTVTNNLKEGLSTGNGGTGGETGQLPPPKK